MALKPRTFRDNALSLVGLIFGVGLVAIFFGNETRNLTTDAATSQKITLDADAVRGHVLPFKIIAAIRNFGFREGMIPAQISVSVEGGAPADWMATGIYIAEHSIGNGAFYTQVEVYVPSPWGDMPPQQYKKLSQVYYAPDPTHSPWSNEDPWTILAAEKAGKLADIEFDKLSNDLLSNNIRDPDKRTNIADSQAKRVIIQKYKLPPTWKPTEGLGLTGTVYHRSHIDVVAGSGVDESMQALSACLRSTDGTVFFKGCYPFGLRSH